MKNYCVAIGILCIGVFFWACTPPMRDYLDSPQEKPRKTDTTGEKNAVSLKRPGAAVLVLAAGGTAGSGSRPDSHRSPSIAGATIMSEDREHGR